MSDENALDPRKWTFSQAYGYEDLPQPLKLGELSNEARTKLWSLLYRDVYNEIEAYRAYKAYRTYTGGRRNLAGKWQDVFRSLHVAFYNTPLDEFDISFENFIHTYKSDLMYKPFNEVFDLLLAIMRHPRCSQEFIRSVAMMFEQCRLAYVVDVNPPPTIYPAATEEEGRTILRAVAELSNAGLSGAVSHLRQASTCINQGYYPARCVIAFMQSSPRLGSSLRTRKTSSRR